MHYDHNRCNKQNNGTSKSLVLFWYAQRYSIDILHLCSIESSIQYALIIAVVVAVVAVIVLHRHSQADTEFIRMR